MTPSFSRSFPVLLAGKSWRRFPYCPASVPWRLVAPCEPRAMANHGLSLEVLARRGGLDPVELGWVLRDEAWGTGLGLVEDEDDDRMSERAVRFLRTVLVQGKVPAPRVDGMAALREMRRKRSFLASSNADR